MIIQLQQVDFSYQPTIPVLEQINLSIESGEFLGIIGPNGGGKTTLLKLILGLIQPTGGRITVLGNPPRKSRSKIGYVPQFKTFNLDFPISVLDIVLMGRLGQSASAVGFNKNDRQIAREILATLDIEPLEKKPIGTLSGGQIQRVMLARALTGKPDILLLDEPTANVDIHAEKNIFDFLKTLSQKGITILVVSHDIGFISPYIKRVACINKTLICHETQKLNAEFMQELYGFPIRAIKHE